MRYSRPKAGGLGLLVKMELLVPSHRDSTRKDILLRKVDIGGSFQEQKTPVVDANYAKYTALVWRAEVPNAGEAG